jgi:hypothetical protein
MDGSPCAVTGESVDGLAVAAAVFLHQLLSLIAMLAGAMAVGCGAVLVLRRLAGGIAGPPAPEAALAVCGAGLLLVGVGDLALRSSTARASGPAMPWLPAVLTRLGLLMAVAAVSLPLRVTSPLDTLTTIATLALSLMVMVRGPVAGLIRGRLSPPGRSAASTPGLAASTAATHTPPAVPTAVPSQPVLLHPTNQAWSEQGTMATPPAGNLVQRFERRVLADGGESVCGRLCVVVPEGSRTGYAHVGFCPPLASQPTVDVTTDYDGVEAVVSAAEVLPWGARIECRLDEPAEETVEIPVDILATSPA